MTVTLPWPFKTCSDSLPSSPEKSETQPDSHSEDPKRSLTVFLRHYSTPGVSPPSARIDSSLKIQERRPIRVWHLWKYGVLAAMKSKSTELAFDLASYQIWGPRKKSWGLEMTVINSLMRGAGRHSALVDITTIRLLMGIGGLMPLPSDALVTPVSFRVKRRNLRGILAEFDRAEDGTRLLSGEWVVGRKTWQRLQAEWEATKSGKRSANSSGGSTPTHRGIRHERVILYIHGGAYYVSSAAAQRIVSIPLSKYTDCRVFDYRLAPETTFPGPLHDAASAYFRLVEDLHIPPENIVLAGDSAGGGLCLALLMYLRDNHYALPSAGILMSPWVDLTMSCESWDSNAPYDVVPMPAPDDHLNPVALYLGDNMEQYMTHPYASPLFGDFRGLPPLLIQAGDSEVLRDEITLLAHKATLAGVEVRHELYEDAVHVFQLYPFLDATAKSFSSMRDFIRRTLPRVQRCTPQALDEGAVKDLEREIENDKVTIVRGDGVETGSGLNEVKENVEPSTTESSSDTDDDPERRRNAFASWGRQSGWYISASTDEDEDDEDNRCRTPVPTQKPKSSPSSPQRRRAGTMPSMSGFERIRSAMTMIMQDPPPPYSPTTTPTSLSHRRGGPSKISLPSSAESPTTMSSMRSIPPSPSVRRSSRATSHQDITNLVEEWTNSGPANRTVVYSPYFPRS
ncbi:hypothetical protein AAF712_004309 [Marasmius tenuissimus]|uniref:Alpha/beta hydrolase fold-3 domain-containing protein n=1 Tax=Marasmius tenuissimus TaxID=585030 RepID=A0ABR3A5I2_9AGAR